MNILPTVRVSPEFTAKRVQDKRCSTLDKASSFVETLILGLVTVGN